MGKTPCYARLHILLGEALPDPYSAPEITGLDGTILVVRIDHLRWDEAGTGIIADVSGMADDSAWMNWQASSGVLAMGSDADDLDAIADGRRQEETPQA